MPSRLINKDADESQPSPQFLPLPFHASQLPGNEPSPSGKRSGRLVDTTAKAGNMKSHSSVDLRSQQLLGVVLAAHPTSSHGTWTQTNPVYADTVFWENPFYSRIWLEGEKKGKLCIFHLRII